MKIAYENDHCSIPEQYTKMSVSQIRTEKDKVLKELLNSDRPQKRTQQNKNNIVFKF